MNSLIILPPPVIRVVNPINSHLLHLTYKPPLTHLSTVSNHSRSITRIPLQQKHVNKETVINYVSAEELKKREAKNLIQAL